VCDFDLFLIWFFVGGFLGPREKRQRILGFFVWGEGRQFGKRLHV